MRLLTNNQINELIVNKSQECFSKYTFLCLPLLPFPLHRYRTASRAGIGDILPTGGDGASTHALGSVR